jgi:hypothetical protein
VDLNYRGVDVPNVTIYKARHKRGINTQWLKRRLNGKITSNANWAMTCSHSVRRSESINIRLILEQLLISFPWISRALSGCFAVELNLLENKPA